MLIALLLAASASPLLADPQITAALGRIEVKPGAWAEYAVRSEGRDDVRVRATVLEEQGDGRFWMELATVGAGGVASAARLLLREGAVSLPEVERIYVMLAGQQPVEVTASDRGAGGSKPVGKAKILGIERVKVPAGAFMARAVQLSRARVWRSAGIPVWGLVKARSARQSVELLAYGQTGGRSVFPEGWLQGNGSEIAK